MLYPLKFEPIYKERVWGGTRLREHLGRECPDGCPVGESWELSGLEGDLSVVSNGFLAGNDISELIEVYMGELVGDRIYNRFGTEFPILVKLIDAREVLSIQVHPDDALAARRHNAYGKNEMWYVLDAEKDARLWLGFRKRVSEGEYRTHLEAGTLDELLKVEAPKKGDAYFVPAGTIHSIGKGILLAEIQQTSDITYRVFDWNRKDEAGNARELHTELAVDALDFQGAEGLKITHAGERNRAVELRRCPHFAVDLVKVDGTVEREYVALDSFVVYLCLEGEIVVECEGGAESMVGTETVLLPAEFETARLQGKGKLLEIYMPR